MKTIQVILAGLLLSIAAGGCAWKQAEENLQKSTALRAGMTKDDVLRIMGEPERNEIYSTPDVWFYYVRPVWIDGLATEDECMPLVFRDGKLVGWGDEYYARMKLQPAPVPEKEK